jgi:hypothetical protein
MNLPSQTALEDAAVQLAYATKQLTPLLEMLELRCEAPPLDPAHRPRWEQNMALLRALKAYFPAVANLLNLHEDQVEAMGQEMANAQARYTEMGVERDYLKSELQQANARHYQALDAFNTLHPRLSRAA